MNSSRDSVPSSTLDPPAPDQLEVALFGPSFGECAVIHIGDGQWVCIDSCINVLSGKQVAIEYLENIGLDASKSLVLVAATHWHDDHIRGLSRVVEIARSAEFVCPAAFGKREFFQLAAAGGRRLMLSSTGVDEFRKILEIARTWPDGRRPQYALEDRLVLRVPTSIGKVEVHALSPSDAALENSLHWFAALIANERTPKGRIPAGLEPNHAAMALCVQVGATSMILGSDLEEHSSPSTGWSKVIRSNVARNIGATLFKVPHHGSKNAFLAEVWTSLLARSPAAILTPFVSGNVRLPTGEGKAQILANTSNAYITSDGRRPKAIRRDRVVERQLARCKSPPIPAASNGGWLRCRNMIGESGQQGWTVELFGTAQHLTNYPAS